MRQIPVHKLDAPSLPVPGADPWHAKPGDPALGVMTDFRDRPSVTVDGSSAIDAALDHMKHAGVRSALVIEVATHRVIGLITAYDISGEKPMSHMRLVGAKRHEVLVRDLMAPVQEWQVAHFEDIQRSTVADVAELFEHATLTHLPVIEQAADGSPQVRGLLSAAKVKRVLVRDAQRRTAG
jgi:CBS domain-containing protein